MTSASGFVSAPNSTASGEASAALFSTLSIACSSPSGGVKARRSDGSSGVIRASGRSTCQRSITAASQASSGCAAGALSCARAASWVRMRLHACACFSSRRQSAPMSGSLANSAASSCAVVWMVASGVASSCAASAAWVPSATMRSSRSCFSRRSASSLVACAQRGVHAGDEKGDQAGADEEVEPHAAQVHAGGRDRVGDRQRLVNEQQQRVIAARHRRQQPHPARAQADCGDDHRHQHQRDERVGRAAAEEHQHGERGEVGQQMRQKFPLRGGNVEPQPPRGGEREQSHQPQHRSHRNQRHADGEAPVQPGDARRPAGDQRHPHGQQRPSRARAGRVGQQGGIGAGGMAAL